MPKLRIAMSETHPRFASHTQSSLMKTRTPVKLKKKPSLRKDVNESEKSQGTMIFKLNGIHKKRSSIIKQSKSMQMLITILKQQRDRRTAVFLHGGSELMETTCLLENSRVSLPSNLINDISCDLKRCTGSPAKLAATIHSKLTKVVDESEKYIKDLHVSFQDGMNCAEKDNSEDTHNFSEDHMITDIACNLQLHLSDEEESADSRREDEVHQLPTESGENLNNIPNKVCFEDYTITDIACKLQLHLSDEEEPADSRREDEVHQRPTKSGENLNDIPNKVCSEVQVHPQGANATTNRKRQRKVWQKNRKFWIQNEHVHNPRNNWSANEKPIINAAATTRKKDTLQKNPVSNQRAWKPPGISKTWVMESTTSLQSMSQKSSQLVEKSTASMKSKHSSIEYINKSTSASIPVKQTKMSMKENRDPRANRMTKICEHLAETKQRQKLQSEGMLPKKRRSKTKIGPKDVRDNANVPSPSKTKTRHSQTPLTMSGESSNIESHCAESTLINRRRTRTLEVIHTLKEIIDSVREDEDAEKSAVKNNDYDHETNNSEILTSSNHDTLQSNDIYTKDINLNRADQFSRRSISTQTELDIPLYRKINAEKNQDLMELSKLTRSIDTQTSPSYVVEIGCNTYVTCNDVEVSCDFTDFTNLKTEVDQITLEDKSMSTVPMSVKHIGINVGNGDSNENEELPLGKCKKTLNTQMSLKLENCDNMEIIAEPTNDASGETEKIMYKEICQNFLQLPKNFDDKTSTDIDEHQESTKCFSNYGASSTSVNNLERSRPSICDYDATCSSKEITECFEENEDTSKLKVEDIPSDMIAAFELAAERARNLHEAVIIYHKNLMSKVSGKRNEETVDDCETSKHHDFEKCASFKSRKNEDNIQNEKIQDENIQHEKSEYEGIYDWSRFRLSVKNSAGMSSCSNASMSNSSTLISDSEYQRLLKNIDTYLEEESDILSGEEEAVTRSNVKERSELDDMKSLMCRIEDEYALELLERTSEKSDESFEMKSLKNYKMLALPAAIKETSLISRANLLTLICCIVCTVIFWCLQFSFQCDSTK